MAPAIRKPFFWSAYHRACALTDNKIHSNLEKQHEFIKQTILADVSLTIDEKSEAIKLLDKDTDYKKLLNNEGTKRICVNCQDECLAKLYCEHCVRNYLKNDFSNWTSGNHDVDNLIQSCQLVTLKPDKIVEWIPYNSLQNIKYLTKGGCSEIYTAVWIDGQYKEWDSNEKKLKRFGSQQVILKRLENFESANRSWFDECKSHLTISTKCGGQVVASFGLTRDPSNGSYMLVMRKFNMNLRKYLQGYHDNLTWKERIRIACRIISALDVIHKENALHRDLHSGNILFHQNTLRFQISDLGFCGPADKPLNSIYGNLPYIAPEVIVGKETSFASDIYSIGILMWEISSGQLPFARFNHDYNLAMNIINGVRPEIIPETPLKYKELMMRCWDSDPTKRPSIDHLKDKINEINRLYHQIDKSVNIYDFPSCPSNEDPLDGLSLSKIHIFEYLSEPRNVTEVPIYYSSIYKLDDDNNPNLHSEDQNKFEISEDGIMES